MFDHSGYKEQYKNTNYLRSIETLDDFPKIKGYDFEQPFDFKDFLESFATTGVQASNLAQGIETVRAMRKDKATIFLSFTSNMVSSGIRDIIRYLVKHKIVHCLVTSAGGVEEDVIKTLRPFVLGSFDTPGRVLFEKGVGRIGNIFAPFDRYLHFEQFINPFLARIYEEQKGRSVPFTPSELIRELGKEVEKNELHEESILYWAYKNDIPVFCPAITDGSLGDLMHFQRQRTKDFYLDAVGDQTRIVKFVLAQEKTAAILLGGGTSKHYVLNANIFRDGLDYAVYITTAQEYDASDSGGNPQEAMTWGKVNINASNVKIKAEASIAFPLLVAGALMEEADSKGEDD